MLAVVPLAFALGYVLQRGVLNFALINYPNVMLDLAGAGRGPRYGSAAAQGLAASGPAAGVAAAEDTLSVVNMGGESAEALFRSMKLSMSSSPEK